MKLVSITGCCGCRNKLQWGEISEKQSMILRCLGVPLPVNPAKVKAKLVKKRGPEPESR